MSVKKFVVKSTFVAKWRIFTAHFVFSWTFCAKPSPQLWLFGKQEWKSHLVNSGLKNVNGTCVLSSDILISQCYVSENVLAGFIGQA